MEGEPVTILDLDIDPSEPAHETPNQGNTDVTNLEALEPCMPMSVPYSFGASCLGPLDVDAFHEGTSLIDEMDNPQHSSALHEVHLGSTRALSPYLVDSRFDDRRDYENMSPYDLRGETAQSLYQAATSDEYDAGFKVEYATDYSHEVPEYKQTLTPQKNNIWQCYDMSDSDDSWVPDNDKENTSSARKIKKSESRTPRRKKTDLGKILTPKSSYTPKPGSRLFSAEERLDLAKYSAIHGIDEAIAHFSEVWGKLVSKKVVITALEKYKMCKRAGHKDPTVEMMQATNKFAQIDRVQMAASCRRIGPTKTAKIFSDKLGMVISESTVRGFAKKY